MHDLYAHIWLVCSEFCAVEFKYSVILQYFDIAYFAMNMMCGMLWYFKFDVYINQNW